MSRLKDWEQAIAVIGSIVVTLVACFAFMQTEHTSMRAEHDSIRDELRAGFAEIRNEMRAGFAELRGAMRDEHAAMRAEHTEMRGAMREEHAEMRGEHAEMRDRLNSIDRRTASIEGHLFGIEVAPDQEATE